MMLSIVTPVYNRADCIGHCIDAVAAQTDGRTDIEHIVVDDGSTDNTRSIIEERAKRYPHLRVHFMDCNRGPNAARNQAIRMAKGDYVVFLDSDDLPAEGALKMITDTIAENPQCNHLLFACDDRFELFKDKPEKVEYSFRDFLEERVSGDFVHVMRRSILSQFPYDEELRIFEGLNFLRIYKAMGSITYFNRVAFNIDRRRTDHVTFSQNMDSPDARDRKIQANELRLARYEDDYRQTETGRLLLLKYQRLLYKLYVMAGKYIQAHTLAKKDSRIAYLPYSLAEKTRTGSLLWLAYSTAAHLKHKF